MPKIKINRSKLSVAKNKADKWRNELKTRKQLDKEEEIIKGRTK